MEITLKDMEELFGATAVELPFDVGSKWLIRTVTFAVTGRVKQIKGKFIVLEDAVLAARRSVFKMVRKGRKLDKTLKSNDKTV